MAAGAERPRATLIEGLLAELRDASTQSVLFSQAVADRVGLSPTDVECLGLLHEQGPMPAGRLAELTGLTSGGVTGLADRLERAGYLRRTADPQDRRRVILTPGSGQAACDIGPLYASIAAAAVALCDQFNDQDLSVILDFMRRSTAMGREEIAKLRADAPPESARPVRVGGPLLQVRYGRRLKSHETN